jgi:hypothetical protein
MKYQTHLLRMRTELDQPVRYYLKNDSGDEILMNSLIGKRIQVRFLGDIHCIHCGNKTKQSFHQGYCYSCFTSLPQTDVGIIHPEKDQSHLGISRDMEWAKENSLVDHIVYIAITGNLKVGVTRFTQVPYRWIDQGAISAIKLARTPNRYLAGLIEVALKAHVADKTAWKEMLGAVNHQVSLINEKKRLVSVLPPDLNIYVTVDNRVSDILYPYKTMQLQYHQINLLNEPEFGGMLAGIKGQYLIFDNGNVLNVRRHNGYLVEINMD